MSKSVVTRYRVDSGLGLSRPVRIAHASDLHERNCDDILEKIRTKNPDLILITGDVFERYDNRPQYDFEHRPVKRLIINIIHYGNFLLNKLMPSEKKANEENARRFLREAVKIAPVYMSLGNHEQKLLESDYSFLEKTGVTLLENADTEVRVRDFRFILGGMSVWDYEEWLPIFLAKGGYKILMCHKPDMYVDLLKESGVDLTLSGHTHGGQVRIGKKGMGFFVPGQGLFGKYAHGSFFDGKLIVSAGCANTVACPRFFNPRELVMIEVR
ncbi:MAG: metallophosphoesterase [Ruminococcus sp.]|nr:metallophosphoesterase [Ruminococcus sp.]